MEQELRSPGLPASLSPQRKRRADPLPVPGSSPCVALRSPSPRFHPTHTCGLLSELAPPGAYIAPTTLSAELSLPQPRGLWLEKVPGPCYLTTGPHVWRVFSEGGARGATTGLPPPTPRWKCRPEQFSGAGHQAVKGCTRSGQRSGHWLTVRLSFRSGGPRPRQPG